MLAIECLSETLTIQFLSGWYTSSPDHVHPQPVPATDLSPLRTVVVAGQNPDGEFPCSVCHGIKKMGHKTWCTPTVRGFVGRGISVLKQMDAEKNKGVPTDTEYWAKVADDMVHRTREPN
jgi:hypothetical protein